MTYVDDLNRLAQDQVVYLTQQLGSDPGAQNNALQTLRGSTVVYRGRLRLAESGNWVFNTSVGANGVEAFILSTATGDWNSNTTTEGGIVVTASFTLLAGTVGQIFAQGGGPVLDVGTARPLQIATVLEMITLSDVIPKDLEE